MYYYHRNNSSHEVKNGTNINSRIAFTLLRIMNHFPKKKSSPTQSPLTKTSDSKYRQLKASRKNSHI